MADPSPKSRGEVEPLKFLALRAVVRPYVPRIADAKRKPMQASELFPRESEVKEAQKLMERLILARESVPHVIISLVASYLRGGLCSFFLNPRDFFKECRKAVIYRRFEVSLVLFDPQDDLMEEERRGFRALLEFMEWLYFAKKDEIEQLRQDFENLIRPPPPPRYTLDERIRYGGPI